MLMAVLPVRSDSEPDPQIYSARGEQEDPTRDGVRVPLIADAATSSTSAERPTAAPVGQIGSATRAVPAAIARGSSTATGSTAEAAPPLWLPLRWGNRGGAPRGRDERLCASVRPTLA